MEEEIVDRVLHNFTELTGIIARWRAVNKKDNRFGYVEGLVEFGTGRNKTEIPVEVKNRVQNLMMPTLINQKNYNKEMLVIANTIDPVLKKELKVLGINYIDAAGNTFIKKDQLMIVIEGQKEKELLQPLMPKPFSKAGLKVIFLFLLNDEFINETIREIAKLADVSLDTVHKTIAGLKHLKYIIPATNKKLAWNNKKELLDRWIVEYETRLKPALHIGNFTFLNEKDFDNWPKIKFQQKETKWGGEPAGELLTNNLKPEYLTIYTHENKMDWIKKYTMIPAANGYIRMYKRFWNDEYFRGNIAPVILIYADLINTGNRRNIETAQKIYEQYLQDKF